MWPDSESLDIAGDGPLRSEIERKIQGKSSIRLIGTYPPGDNSILSNYVYLDEKSLQSIFVLDGGANIPFISGLKFGMASNMADVPNKPPLKLIFPDSNNVFKNVQYTWVAPNLLFHFTAIWTSVSCKI